MRAGNSFGILGTNSEPMLRVDGVGPDVLHEGNYCEGELAELDMGMQGSTKSMWIGDADVVG